MKKANRLLSVFLVFVLSFFLVSTINVKAEQEPVTVNAVFTDHKTNVPEGDITSMFGLDEDIFSVYVNKHSAANLMWMTASEVRLYSVRASGDGNELVFEVNEGYEILSVEFTIKASDSPDAEVFVDEESFNVYSKYGTKITIDELSAKSVSIKNVHTGGDKNLQLHITGIEITYLKEPGLVESIDGASIRTEGIQGLRFYAEVAGDNQDLEDKGFYLMFGKATITNLKAAISNDMKDANGKDVIKVSVPGVNSENEYSVVLIGIPEKGYLDAITVIPYAKNGDSGSEEYAIPVTRSVAEVAINMEKANETMPKDIETSLANFTKVRLVGDNLEISKGLKDSEDEYVDFELYDIYHPDIEEITLPDFDGNGAFVGWYEDAGFNVGPVTSINPLVTNDLILYPKWVELYDFVEDFEGTTNLTASYTANSFIGADDVEFKYFNSRDEFTYPIDGKGIMFQNNTSYIEFVLPKGFKELYFEYRKAFTGGDNREIKLYIDGVEVDATVTFGSGSGEQSTIYKFVYEPDAPVEGPAIVKIQNNGAQVTIDNIKWIEHQEGTTYTVAFNSNGGSSVANQTIKEGNKATEPSEPTKDEHIFKGWYLDDVTFVEPWEFDEGVTGDIILYAKWEELADDLSGIYTTDFANAVNSTVINDSENFASQLGLSSDLFTIKGYKEGASNWPRVYTTNPNYIRTYYSSGVLSYLEIKIAEGYQIDEIEVVFKNNASNTDSGYIKINDGLLISVANASKTKTDTTGKVVINGDTVKIYNASTGNCQVVINEIIIKVSKEGSK